MVLRSNAETLAKYQLLYVQFREMSDRFYVVMATFAQRFNITVQNLWVRRRLSLPPGYPPGNSD